MEQISKIKINFLFSVKDITYLHKNENLYPVAKRIRTLKQNSRTSIKINGANVNDLRYVYKISILRVQKHCHLQLMVQSGSERDTRFCCDSSVEGLTKTAPTIRGQSITNNY